MPAIDDFDALLQLLFGWLLALGLAAPRAMGILLILPVFTRMGLQGLIRQGVVLAIALPLLPHVLGELEQAGGIGAIQLALLILKEAFVGVMLGIAFGIPFWGVDAAGDVIDLQRGSNAANLIDPSSTSESSVTGTLLVLVMIALFFAASGMTLVIGALYESYAYWPLLDFLPTLSGEAGLVFLGLLDRVMQLAVIIGGPLILAMFLGDLVLMMIARFAPQLDVFNLSLPVKSLILALLMPLYAVFLFDYLEDGLAPLRDVMDQAGALFR